MNYQKKYLKYKQKYINLKNIIGGGINAEYTENGNIITLRYKLNEIDYEIKYKKTQELGKGGFGQVWLIEREDDSQNKYILKIGLYPDKYESYIEGKNSELLEGILDDNMLVLFQGKFEKDFLISTYNGKDLMNEYQTISLDDKISKLSPILIQTLDLLHRINTFGFYHNDIKLKNITVKGEKVSLIDFGFLDVTSRLGSFTSMSYRSLIEFLKVYDFNPYDKTFPYLTSIIKDTDIFGFFYCCIDLLFLIHTGNTFQSNKLLGFLKIKRYDAISFKTIFELYYFILPKSLRQIDNLINYENIEAKFNSILPLISHTRTVFGDIPPDNENLFRYMTFIYDRLVFNNILLYFTNDSLKNFIKVISDCLLPQFDYETFKPKFIESIEQLVLSKKI
jgi:serine/threonine protein kinase